MILRSIIVMIVLRQSVLGAASSTGSARSCNWSAYLPQSPFRSTPRLRVLPKTLVKVGDVSSVYPNPGLRFVRAGAVADQPNLVRLVVRVGPGRAVAPPKSSRITVICSNSGAPVMTRFVMVYRSIFRGSVISFSLGMGRALAGDRLQ